jgi:hypothetical protein
MLASTIARGSKWRHASRIAVTRGVMRPSISPHHGAVGRVVNHAGLQVVGAEVDERADRALGADDLRDRELVEPVLRRHDVVRLR